MNRMGYSGYAGAEYNPIATTDEGISWLKEFQKL